MSEASDKQLDLHAETPAGRVRSEIASEGISQAAAAAGIGISDAALSQWLRGVYGGDSDAVAEKASRWLATQSERRKLLAASPGPPAWAPTPLARRAMAALAQAHLAGDMCAVYGAPGLGKTIAARRYAGLRPNVWIATATRGKRSVTGCLRAVADAMQLRSVPRRAADLEDAAIERMRGSGGLLVVDEAQHLPVASLEELRSLHDASGCGLALVGSDPLWLRLSAGRHPDLAQLYSRVGKRVRLGRPSAADVAALLAAWQLSGAGLEFHAGQIATRAGGLRSLTKALSLARSAADGKSVEPRHLRAAWRDLASESLPAQDPRDETRKNTNGGHAND